MFMFVVSAIAINAAPFQDVVHRLPKCHKVMKKHDLTGRFPGAVAHGIHSITLEDIRHYFNPYATENNGVPTLNYDLKSKQPVLPNAILYGFDTTFKTVGMRYVDQVMRHMDRKSFYLTGYNTLEQLVHTFHMGEVWANAKVHYDRIIRKSPYDPLLCACVNDIENNGIMKMLPFMSLKIRYPGLTAGKILDLGNGTYADWSGNLYRYAFFNNWSEELSRFNFNEEESVVLKKASERLVDGDEGIEHLSDEKQWMKWKSGMKKMNPHDDYELAMFLYCRLKGQKGSQK